MLEKKKNQLLSKAFGAAIRNERQRQRISQEELAARSDLHRTYLADVERGNRNPSLYSIGQIATGLRLKTSKLFALTEKCLRKSSGE